MTNPTTLSPAAQAVLDAVEDDCIHPTDLHRIAAAALRAAVDQLLPLHACSLTSTRGTTRLGMRQKLLTIAAELEGAQ